MSIWEHDNISPNFERMARLRDCPFCFKFLATLVSEKRGNLYDDASELEMVVRVCPSCGWWNAFKSSALLEDATAKRTDSFPPKFLASTEGAAASLKNLDISDVSAPLDEIRQYLVARYEHRFNVSPRRFERLVQSVFSDLGYSVCATAYTKDGGIDAILDDGNSRIGVQVKRTINKIEVDQIRSLTGALVLGGYTKGIFVTTSSFTKGSIQASNRFQELGYPIELVDAVSFYNQLELVQREMYNSLDDFPVNIVLLNLRGINSAKYY